MKRHHLIAALIVGLVLASPLVAGYGEKCSADAQTCLNKMASKIKSRGWVGLELDKSEMGDNLVVVLVETNSPAEAGGFQKGDVLTALNGIEFAEENHEKLSYAKQAMKPGKEVTYTVMRGGCCHKAGEAQEIHVTLAEVPADVMAKWVGNHMIEDHAAIEVVQAAD